MRFPGCCSLGVHRIWHHGEAKGRPGKAGVHAPQHASHEHGEVIIAESPRAFVIGHPISHSRSPMLHGHWLRTLGLAGRYDAVDVPPEGLGGFVAGMREAGFVGGNVTIPHKQAVMTHLERIDAAAQAIGAVNTVWLEGGTLVGGNTDAHGFLANLDEGAPGWDQAATAVLLGAGGAARAICHGLLQRGLAVRVANRSRGAAEALAAQFGSRVIAGDWTDLPRWLSDAGLLVNATALGMAGAPPLALDIAALRADAVVCDIVYVPRDTALLRDAAARGHRTVDGLGMLLHQAAPGFARWFGQAPTVTAALRALLAADIDRTTRGQVSPAASLPTDGSRAGESSGCSASA